MSIDQDMEYAQQAVSVVNNPAFKRGFEALATAIHEQWEATPIRDHEGAHQLKLMLKLLGDVRANLERAIADGKMAAHELDQRRKSKLADFRR
jgi:hypothetical protein